jgi:hypothetical protein
MAAHGAIAPPKFGFISASRTWLRRKVEMRNVVNDAGTYLRQWRVNLLTCSRLVRT